MCVTDGISIGKKYLLFYFFDSYGSAIYHMNVISYSLSSCVFVLMKCVGETGASCHNFYFSQGV